MSARKMRLADWLALPWRITRLVYWDIRCGWFMRHQWVTVRQEWWTLRRGPSGHEVYERCVNQFCRAVKPGSWHIEPGGESELPT